MAVTLEHSNAENSTIVIGIPATPRMKAVAWCLKNYDTKCFD